MEIVNQVGSSTLTLTDDALTLTISRSFFTLRQWQWLVGLLTDLIAAGLAWASARAQPSGAGAHPPRAVQRRGDSAALAAGEPGLVEHLALPIVSSQ